MSPGRQKISFDGLLQENVLGTFKVIRGFSDCLKKELGAWFQKT